MEWRLCQALGLRVPDVLDLPETERAFYRARMVADSRETRQ